MPLVVYAFLKAHSYSWNVFEDRRAVKSKPDVKLVSFCFVQFSWSY